MTENTWVKFYNTDNTNYWKFYPSAIKPTINLTGMGVFHTSKEKARTKEILEKLNDDGIDGLKFYNTRLEDPSEDLIQRTMINRCSYISLNNLPKDQDLLCYIPENIKKLEIINVASSDLNQKFWEFLSTKKLDYFRFVMHHHEFDGSENYFYKMLSNCKTYCLDINVN